MRKIFLYSTIYFSIIISFSACGHLSPDGPKKLDEEIQSISEFVNSEKLRELKNKIAELRNRHKETHINLTMVEDAISRVKLGIDRLKPEYQNIALTRERPADKKYIPELLFSIEDEIAIMKNDLQWLKERSGIQTWNQM